MFLSACYVVDSDVSAICVLTHLISPEAQERIQ